MTERQVIEINGVKMEVDLRTAKRVDTLQVGTRVKLLKKTYSGFDIKHGVIVGFEPFKALPTIIVAFIECPYSSAPEIKFEYFNAETKDVELVVSIDDDKEALTKAEIEGSIDRAIQKKHEEIRDLEDRKRYFQEKFACYWVPVETKEENAA